MANLCRLLFVFLLASISYGQVSTAEKIPPPLSYGIIADNSGSMRSYLESVILTADSIISKNSPQDETFIVRFVGREKIERLQDLTLDRNKLKVATENLYIEGGQTALLDALERSATYLISKRNPEPSNRRSALILITDGEERESSQKYSDLIKVLKDGKTRIFVIGVGESVKSKFLQKLADDSGGKLYVPKKVGELNAAVDSIFLELRNP